MKKIHDTTSVLHSPFNLETHKEVFVDYLEVIIHSDGTVEYAVPSHQEKLIRVACEKLKITRQELIDRCPDEFRFDVMNWLCSITDCVSVWNDTYIGHLNETQQWVLQNLRYHGVYKGECTNPPNSECGECPVWLGTSDLSIEETKKLCSERHCHLLKE